MTISTFPQNDRDAPLDDRLLDALIDVAARRPLERALSLEFNSSTEGFAAVIVCDLDRFRRVNEALGYEAGDVLLRTVARRLHDAISEAGRLAWIGGDQFMLVSSSMRSALDVDVAVERLRAAVQAPVQLREQLVYPTATFGRAWRDVRTGSDSAVGAELMRLAEADMHRRKVLPRAVSTSECGGMLLQLDSDLRGATGRQELFAHFQPLYETRTGALVAFEALARWAHPNLGSIPPDVFIPLAEDNGLIHDIGARMLSTARAFLGETDNRVICVYVNVSAEQLAHAGFADEVARIFDRDGALLSRLILEITETSLMVDRARVLTELIALRQLGVGVAIDDFGSGYSSLLQLQELPVTHLKIDKALVQRDGALGYAVLRAVVQLAKHLDLIVVAEGVEQPEQLRLLGELDCDRVQGFLFSPALPPNAAHQLPRTLPIHADRQGG